jgi:hypothetical protein
VGLPHRAATQAALQELTMELTGKEIQLLAQLSRDRGLYAECKGAELDALQELGLLQWFDARSSTTPFKEDPRPLFKLLLMSGRIDYFWVAAVENWPELVGPGVPAMVDAIEEIDGRASSTGRAAKSKSSLRDARTSPSPGAGQQL